MLSINLYNLMLQSEFDALRRAVLCHIFYFVGG